MKAEAHCLPSRRLALKIVGGATLAQAAGPSRAAAPVPVRIVTNAGADNAILIQFIETLGFLRAVGAAEQMITVKAPPDCLAALVQNKADVCVTSAFNGLLPAIEKGAPVKIVGAAQQTPALAVFSSRPDIRHVSDLVGKTVGIGPPKALLHVAMIALLKAKGVDATKVRFVSIGSNAEVYRAVKAGQVDAGPSDVSNTAGGGSVHVLTDGKMWSELPDYPYQFAYASDRALRENRDGVVRALAGYGKMFRFLSSPDSLTPYLQAARAVGESEAAARAAWTYVQSVHPYAGSPETSEARISYLQALDVSVGLQRSILPLAAVADLSVGRDAAKLV